MTAVIGYGNLIDTASLGTIGTWSGTYPVTNVKNRFLKVFARATSTSCGIYMDLGSAKSIGMMGLVGISVPSDTIIDINASTNAWSSSSTIVDNLSVAAYGSGSSIFYTFPEQSFRYWMFLLTSATGVFDVGRVFIGPRFRPGYGLSFGASLGLEDRTTRSESSGGARFHRVKTPRRTLTGEMEFLTDAEAAAWRGIMRTYGSHSEYVLLWDDADTSAYREDRNMLCNLDELSEVEFPYATQRKIGLKFSEIIA